jgi:hypothetical protein
MGGFSMLGTFNTEVVTTLLIDAEASDNVCWLNAKEAAD